MKISVDIDCSPEEARRFLGLPDLSSVHEAYIEQMRSFVVQGVTPDMVEQMLRTWSPLGDAGMGMWRQMVERMGGASETK